MKYFHLIFLVLFVACKKDPNIAPYKTEKAIIIVMDGARYSETWGDENHTYIPKQSALSNLSVLNDHFYNQ
jgi:hypothetical protein